MRTVFLLIVQFCTDLRFRFCIEPERSYSNDVRIRKPNEFDCIFILEIPYGIGLNGLKINGKRNGYFAVNLFKEFRKDKELRYLYKKLKQDLLDDGLLNRVKLQHWLKDIIESVFAKYLQGGFQDLEIQYGKRATAHNVYVSETNAPYKKISIDFVCGLKVDNEKRRIPGKMSTTPVYDKHSWYIVPKASKWTAYSFMLTSPGFEHAMLWNRNNLKNSCRLLKALRDHYELDAIRSYFIITCFLYEVEKRPEAYWLQPLSVILLNTVKQLLEFLKNKYLPYFWIRKTNLLGDVNKSIIKDYRKVLTEVYKELQTLSLAAKGHCSYHTVAKHFELPKKDKENHNHTNQYHSFE